MELQHLNAKLFLTEAKDLDLEIFIPIFHRWIQNKTRPELLIDVADYKHVPAGPGVMLISHDANYSIDDEDHRLGLLYNRKILNSGSNQDRLAQCFRSVLEAALLLENEAELKDKIHFKKDEIYLCINDRALAPNQEKTYAELEPELKTFFSKLLGHSDFILEREANPLKRCGVTVKTQETFSLEKILQNI